MRQSSCHSFPLNEGGFTLIEVLMALFIGAIVLTIVNMSFFQVHRSVEAVSSQRQAYQMVRIVMDRMVRDLTCSYAPNVGDPGSGTQQVQMTEDEISMYRFVGLDETKDKKDLDSISFTTVTDLGLPGGLGVVKEVGYALKEMEDAKGRYLLIRTEDQLPHLGVTKAGRKMEMAEDVVSLDIKYIDAALKENDSWDLAQMYKLPRQVKITVTFSIEGEEVSFSGVAFLPLSDLPEIKAFSPGPGGGG